MSNKSFVKSISNLNLDEKLQQLVVGEREILTEIIIYIREVDSRKMYLSFGYPSLFEYPVIAKKDKAASIKKPRSAKVSSSEIKIADLDTSQDRDQMNPKRTTIPKSIQHAVFVRDKCCQFQIKETGHKCSSTWNLTLDHIKPVWAGGTNSVDNLRVFCASHNAEIYRQQAGIRLV